MKKSTKILLLLLCVVVFACSLSTWAEYSPVVDDYRWIYDRDTDDNLVSAFATALRINHPAAYDMIDPTLKPRLDEWMNTHQSKECTREFDVFLVGPDENGDYGVSFGCFGADGQITMEIDNIVIKDMKVIDWGEIREED